MRFITTIQSKIILTFMIFVVVILLIITALSSLTQDTSRIDKISQQYILISAALERSWRGTENYLKYAARDYPSYYRDIDVYYKPLMRDIEDMNARINGLSSGASDFSYYAQVLLATKNIEIEALDGIIVNTQKEWKNFYSELRQKLGPDRQEPRIEWGAGVIHERGQALIDIFTGYKNKLLTMSTIMAQQTNLLGNLIFYIVFAFSLVFIAWFYAKVLRPLKTTEQAINNLSNTTINENLSVTGNNEIDKLKVSLNQLAKRNALMMSVVTHISQSDSLQNIVDQLYYILSQTVSINSVYIAEVAGDQKQFMITDVAPFKEFKNFHKFGRKNPIAINASELLSDQITVLNDCENYFHLNANAKLIKQLYAQYPLQSLLFLPLRDDEKSCQYLVVGSYKKYAFDQSFLLLIEAMWPLLSNAMQQFNATESI